MSDEQSLEGRIAIVGMAGRFPGAPSVNAWWANLCQGVESVRFFSDAEIDDWFDPAVRAAPNYVAARPVLDDVEMFDAGFFGMHARDAELTDPQQRVFLECAWQALEDGGYDPGAYTGTIGVYAGASMNTYFLNNVCQDRRSLEEFTTNFQVGEYSTLLGAGREFLATRVSYKLDLKGPSMTIQTACSTSLVAIAQACQALLLYQTDMALAGGVSITFPQHRGYLHQDGGMVSADGHCRPFDAAASGTIFGSGAGVVLLKRLDEAVVDGDHIYAVILGCGLSNDGAEKVGFTAPSIDGQVAAIAQALAQAGVDARSIGYVECHGTATPLGDPIEIAALIKAFRLSTEDTQFCAIGSAKGNIGHLDAAAGVTGLIKTALMLRHRRMVPSLHYVRPNARIDFATSPFWVNTDAAEWKSELPRRAGVSSLGVGGTNAHVVLEEPPPQSPRDDSLAGAEVLLLSARSATALEQMRGQLSSALETSGSHAPGLADIAFTLQRGRREFAHRCAIVARDRADAAAVLVARDGVRRSEAEAAGAAPPVVFMFPGQGAQHLQMAAAVYRRFPQFRAALDCCATVLRAHDVDLIAALYGDTSEAATERLSMTGTAQPAIFAVEYALAMLWQSWGITPTACIGHSVGEFTAACIAGVFSLEDALRLVALRGRLMEQLPRGFMLAVRLAEGALGAFLEPGISIAAVNSPSLCVLAGPFEQLEALEQRLDRAGAAHRRLHTSHAFHSAMMDPMIAPFAQALRTVSLSAPTVPYVSCVTGAWITQSEAMSPDYWARHAREPVRFATAVQTVSAEGTPLLLEVGPGNTLCLLASQNVRTLARAIVASLPDANQPSRDDETLLLAAGKLWTHGAAMDWSAIAVAPGRRVPLPGYAFERKRYWIDPPAKMSRIEQAQPTAVPVQELANTSATKSEINEQTMNAVTPNISGAASVQAQLSMIGAAIGEILENISGESVEGAAPSMTFLEMGFDSLLLSQVAQQLQARFKVKVAFRQLLGDLSTITALSRFIADQLPPPALTLAPAVNMAAAEPLVVTENTPMTANIDDGAQLDGVAGLMRAQVEAMSRLIGQQLESLQRIGLAETSSIQTASAAIPASSAPSAIVDLPASEQRPSRFQSFVPSRKSADSGITAAQRRHIDKLAARFNAKTVGSKRFTETYRGVLADPRAAAGFRLEWKELVYPIVCARSQGSRLWDVDGNEYIDLVNGYGPTAFGHAPDFVVNALKEQLDKGFAIGPQSDLAGEVAALFTEMTGNDRMTFCNTGSEAVMAAMRIARTVTGRTKVVMFNGDYHGQFDEVLVKGVKRSDGSLRSVPVAAGIPPSAVENIVVLDYGTAPSMEWIRAHAEELAAVIVEPVQSRHPALQPFAFLKELREVTAANGIAFVMDEIVTGFRVHSGGMQAVTGIRADLATYGKVIGGGMPIGILAGRREFMDALDGGAWQYGDDSVPEVGVTFFAGTFVRHPLALAAVRAVLLHLKSIDPAEQDRAERHAIKLTDAINRLFEDYDVPAKAERYSSFLYFSLYAADPMAALLFYHLRDRGIHVQDGFPFFLTSAHTDADIATIMAAFADSLAEMTADGILAAPAVEAKPAPSAGGDLKLTESQMEIWLSAQSSDEASCAFNESVTLQFAGSLDVQALRGAIEALIGRHDALRLRFSPTGESISVITDCGYDFRDVNATTAGVVPPEQALADTIAEDANVAFDLVDGPTVRVRLVHLSPGVQALVLTVHHIICDGWSINVLISELAELYDAARSGRPPDLAPALSFSAYAQSLAERTPGDRATTENYWLDQYRSVPAPIDLPTDFPRPMVKSFAGATRSHKIDRTLYRAVKAAGARHGCTLFVTLLAAFELLMGRLASVDDVVIGVPTAGQSLIEDQALVGHCVNFLPIRGQWQKDTTFAQHLRAVSRQVLDAYEHQEYTLGTLVRQLAPARQANRLPLTELQFNLERLTNHIRVAGLEIDAVPNPKTHVNFDIFCNIIESDDGLRLDWDYNTDVFKAATIDLWLACYETLLASFVTDADVEVSRITYLPKTETLGLADGFNDTAADFPSTLCVHTLIERSVAAHPDATALLYAGLSLTYRQLDERANQLAHHLRATVQGPGARVGVLMERSPAVLIALLAVWKAGCAYVPLDPAHPAARLRHMLADADIAAVLTDGEVSNVVLPAGVTAIDVRREQEAIAAQPSGSPPCVQTSEDAAYLIYTSGSTGTPKGVEVSHRSLANLLVSIVGSPGIAPSDVLLAITTVSFDIAALELFAPLVAGATVALAERDDTIDGNRLVALMDSTSATMMQATPASWQLLVEAGFHAPRGFKMLCGGDAMPRALADRLLDGAGRLWNMYGPTETTVWSSCAEIHAGGGAISIGRPIANTRMYILDAGREPVARGAIGELWIGGDGVAIGYFRQPQLTAERFVADPSVVGARMYRTGDLARCDADGILRLVGRADTQVKLRGFRVELGEIEAALSRVSGITGAAVALREDQPGRRQLVGYVVMAGDDDRWQDQVYSALADELPDYMIPSAWVRLERLPVSINGKLDRAALPMPQVEALVAEDYEPPATPLEVTLASIWADVLQLERVGRNDDLFRLGADSIHVFQIAARASKCGIVCSAKHVLKHRTVAALAAALEVAEQTASDRRPALSLRDFRRSSLEAAD
jgi:amino acid adenylation domain-containing protein